ncbi:hypothetical protein AOCH_001698 [Aspergillus ochraceoroseus]|uniref:Uncharacterized protein n=1 Tax=Aspergillus ochraceoroseus TaxID=138278 RepID=A0A0F8X300_9EURO|nr:hypothetical protein AOCH_001698 [Aspergillus ochraceoroseus]
MRSTKKSNGIWVPNDINVQYYSQRASRGGLMLAEANPSADPLELIQKARWLPWSPWNFHAGPNRGTEKSHRYLPRQRCLYPMLDVARWPCYDTRYTRWTACPLFDQYSYGRKGSGWHRVCMQRFPRTDDEGANPRDSPVGAKKRYYLWPKRLPSSQDQVLD